jgi:hypothetical protein
MPLEWREMRDDDYNYVLSSWLRSYADSGDAGDMHRGAFFRTHEPIVKDILGRSVVMVAWTRDLPDTVLGWICVEGDDVLHYWLTKRRFRRMGIATWMLGEFRALPAIYTYSTSVPGLLGTEWTYDPMRRFERKAA